MAIPFRYRLLLASVPLLVAALSWGGALQHARDSVGDLLFTPHSAPRDVTIIAIDETSIGAIGQWPWPRATFARALPRLAGARAIGIDVNFKEASRLGTADDRALADALRTSAVPVVLASELQPDGTIIGPIAVLASASTQGLANLTLDPDGTARTIQLSRSGMPFLAAQVAVAGGEEFLFPGRPLHVRYAGSETTVPTYSFMDLVEGRIPAGELDGQFIFIGATARDLQDYRHTPLGLMSGVEIQANVLANILTDSFLRTSRPVDALITLVAGLCGLAVGLLVRRVWLMLVALAAVIAVVWLGVFITFEGGLLLDLVMPTVAAMVSCMAGVLTRYILTIRERRFIHDTFSHYLAPQVVAELLRNPKKIRLGGEKRELTILFSDIRGFTSLSETMTPTDLAHFLNRYLGVMTDIVMERRGVVDKYIGDAIMAFWGAPLDDDQHARNGIETAVAMVEALERFNRDSVATGMPTIAVGIGLNTGAVTVGNMGSERRFDYTVIGDDVNLASRLESLTKTYGVSILVSGTVLHHVQDGAVASREIDRVRVKGKSQPVTLYEVMTPAGAARLQPHLSIFADGLAHYYAGRWLEAVAALDSFLGRVGADGPATLLKERCQGFVHRPADDWEGVFEMTHK